MKTKKEILLSIYIKLFAYKDPLLTQKVLIEEREFNHSIPYEKYTSRLFDAFSALADKDIDSFKDNLPKEFYTFEVRFSPMVVEMVSVELSKKRKELNK